MKSVRAKFYVDHVTKYKGEHGSVVLLPVTSGSEENKTFWKYTPSGKLEMTINSSALDAFTPGQEFYLDFTPVEDEHEG